MHNSVSQKGIVVSKQANKNGYFPACKNDSECTGCAMCAIVCPDAAIEVFCESKVKTAKSDKKGKPKLIKEKA